MLPQTSPTTTPVTSSEVFLDCPDCLAARLFVMPACDEHDAGCAERMCVECGAAVVLVQPTTQSPAARALRHVA